MSTAARRVLGVALSALLLTIAAPAAAGASDPGKPPFDIRDHQRTPAPAPADARTASDREHLSDRLGRQGVLDFDGQTNTAKFVGKLDGFLTGPSGDDPAKIALDYVRAHEAVFGLTSKEVDNLKLVRNYADEGGTTHLVWAQVLDGITAFDNDVHANVARDGRLINVSGSPVAKFATRTTQPDLSPSDAVAKALTDAGRPGAALRPRDHGTADQLTTFAGGHDARLVLFTERPGDTHLAWEVTANKDADEIYDYVIDARSGQLLYRENTVDFAAANLSVWEYAPNLNNAFAGVPPQAGQQTVHSTLFGGDQIQVNDGNALNGPYAHTYADVNDDNAADAGDEIPASSGTTWNYPFTDFCGTPFPKCSWAGTANSWQTNLRQNAAQVYFYVNNFHDWLAKSNVGFTAASGNFEAAGGDAVQAQVLDGANKSSGLPDHDHSNNANMSTPPDGGAPRMQMYLFDGGLSANAPLANGGDDASVIYHEYAHGLSNRLVTGGTGAPALRSFHARAMGEGWSDYYAMDYLFAQHLDPVDDVGTQGEVNIGLYMTGGDINTSLRSEPIDCTAGGANQNGCTGGNTPHTGGYTLADMGNVIAQGPEFHADGEIWAQALWQIRQQVGADTARRVITDGMRLSPPDPSFLDMRNGILQADQVAFGGAHLTQLWQVFSNRGMGPGAAVDSGADTTPVADFSTPATNGTTVTGRVTDAATGAGVAGAYVYFDASAAPGDYATTTDGNGNYSLSAVQPGVIGRALVSAPGFGHLERANVQIGGNVVDFALERNFAAASGGGAIAAFSGPDFGPSGCGPGGAIDGTLATGWGSTSPNNPGQGLGGAKAIVVRLPQALDVSRIAVDPTANCGDSDSASTGQFTVDVSADGTNFRQVAASSFNASNLRRVNNVAGAASNVRFVRFTMVSPQRQLTAGGDGQGGRDSGADFMDSSEIEVFGAPVAPPGGGGGGGGGPGITRDITAPIGKLALVARQKLKTALAKGMKVTVDCNEPCAATLGATLDAKTAKKLKLLPRKSKAKTVKVASGKLGPGPGKRTATLKFTSKAKTAFKRQKKVKLAVTAALTDAAGNGSSSKLTATLKR